MTIELLREMYHDITSRNLSRELDKSAVGVALAIQQITLAVDTHGVEAVGKWFRNIAYLEGYDVTVSAKSLSPGTEGDPRR